MSSFHFRMSLELPLQMLQSLLSVKSLRGSQLLTLHQHGKITRGRTKDVGSLVKHFYFYFYFEGNFMNAFIYQLIKMIKG